jgi:hypothetical protein
LFFKELFLTGNHFLLTYIYIFLLILSIFLVVYFIILKYFTQFDKIIVNLGGVPTLLARKIAAAKKRGRGGKEKGFGGKDSRPARAEIIKIQRLDFL